MDRLDPYQAQFTSPMSTYEGYGIDPSLMTPAYMANFRPAYHNPYMENEPYLRDIASAPADGLAWGAQNVGVPLATWWAANKMLKGSGEKLGAGIARAGVSGLGSLVSRGFTKVGAGMIPRAAGSLGMGSVLGGAAGYAGGMIGGMLLPIAAATAATSIVNTGFVDNYSSIREGRGALQDNLSKVYTGAGLNGRRGVGAMRSAQLAEKINKIGVDDQRFDGMDVQEIADLAMKAGTLQEFTMMDSDSIVEAVKSTVDTIKVIQDVTGNRDFKEAVDYLAKLKRAGLTNNRQMSAAMSEIASMAGVAGVSIGQMVDSVGAQGHLIFQQAGMAPTVGMKTSMGAYAGFTNAYRSGLVSNSQMAALGGVEGATQLVTQGAMEAATDHWSVLMGMTGADSIDGALGDFSRRGNPMEAMGDMYMNRSVYSQKFMEGETAGTTILKQLVTQLKSMYGNEKVTLSKLANVAQMNGMNPQVFRAAVLENESLKDSKSIAMASSARRASNTDRFVNTLEESGLANQGVPLIGAMERGLVRAKRGIKNFGDDTAGWLNIASGGAEDLMNYLGFAGYGIDDPARQYAVMDDGLSRIEIGKRGKRRNGTYSGFQRDSKYDGIMAKLLEGTTSFDEDVRKLSRKVLSGPIIDTDALVELNAIRRGDIFGTESMIDAKIAARDMKGLSVNRTDIKGNDDSLYRDRFKIFDDDEFRGLMGSIRAAEGIENGLLANVKRVIVGDPNSRDAKRARKALAAAGFSEEQISKWSKGEESVDDQKRFRDFYTNVQADTINGLDLTKEEDFQKAIKAMTEGMPTLDRDALVQNLSSRWKAVGGKAEASANKFLDLQEEINTTQASIKAPNTGIDIEGVEYMKEATVSMGEFNRVLGSDDGTVSMFGKLNTRLRDVNNELDRLKNNSEMLRRQRGINGN